MFAEFYFAAEVIHPRSRERMQLAFVRHMSEYEHYGCEWWTWR